MTPNIILHTEQNPEDNAMLQALYSRSADSVLKHLERLKEVGSGKFMEQYYVGYGHNSIADCGFITVYFEGISMLAAKAIEDSPLFNGQESSSRYIDWSEQPFFNPYTNSANEELAEEAEILLDEIRKFYVGSIKPVKDHLMVNFPKDAEASEAVYARTINAKTFDIMRGFLPCGAVTNVAWTTSLRKAREHLDLLKMHPLAEVRSIASISYAKLTESYPSSFPITESDSSKEASEYKFSYFNFYAERPVQNDANYYIRNVEKPDVYCMEGEPGMMEKRPPRTTFHKHEITARLRRFDVFSEIDFGSFRDLQRHRGGYCSMPLVDNSLGFHQWYYDQLPDEVKANANDLMDSISKFMTLTVPEDNPLRTEEEMMKARTDNYVAKLKNQYVLPMGTIVPVVLSYDLPQMAYVMELRTGQTVHPTLRKYFQDIFQDIDKMGNAANSYLCPNMTPDEFGLKRGTQDIIKKREGYCETTGDIRGFYN